MMQSCVLGGCGHQRGKQTDRIRDAPGIGENVGELEHPLEIIRLPRNETAHRGDR